MDLNHLKTIQVFLDLGLFDKKIIQVFLDLGLFD